MEAHHFILLILLAANNFLKQGLATNSNDEKLTLERRLQIINKPAKKSFVTEYGDILDCVDINKQFAFDHPLLKNHTVQMKPTSDLRTSISMPFDFLPENMRCPQGTVPVKRIQEEDLLMEEFIPLFSTMTNLSKADVMRHEVAGIIAPFNNLGASGIINLWNPQVQPGQHSAACIYVANDDGPVSNVVQTGWMVSSMVDNNSTKTRLYAYWTKDSGKSTGCFNTLCPGFVQISTKVYLGAVIEPVSRYFTKEQHFLDFQIQQDIRTKIWWLYCCNGEAVGYWPKELFSTLAKVGTRAGWGGEIYSPATEEEPEMGSGRQADDGGYTRVCLMKNLKMLAPELFPQATDLQYSMTSPSSYTVICNKYGDWDNYIYFGGPNKI